MTPSNEGRLSQEEVDALLNATAQAEHEQEARGEPSRRVQGYDFLQPSRFNTSALEKMRRLHDELTQHLTTLASRRMRGNAKVQLASMDQIKWEHLLEEVGGSVVGFLFTLEPLGQTGIVSVDRDFAIACLERMMGASAETLENADPEFTELDTVVLGGLIEDFLGRLPSLWRRLGEFEVKLGRFVSDLQTLDTFSSDEDFFQLCFLVQTSVGSGQVVLSTPFEAVRELPPDGTREPEEQVRELDEDAREGMRRNLEKVDVRLKVVLGGADVRVERLVRAAPGDVIMLDRELGETVDVFVNDVHKFKGYPGQTNGKLAVKVLIEEARND